jgi:hypothetical protein
MKHARTDYARIQDPAGKIPEDEPVFLIRAQDVAGPTAVLCWANVAEREGASKEIVEAARLQAARMHTWQMQRGSKVPDLPAEYPQPIPLPQEVDTEALTKKDKPGPIDPAHLVEYWGGS